MKYKFVINEATETPAKAEIEFRARTEARAYQFVIRHVLNRESNRPLKKGTLHKLEAFGWEQLMTWKSGPGWVWEGGPKSNGNGLVDNRIAPGS